jgi:hypothetical protein
MRRRWAGREGLGSVRLPDLNRGKPKHLMPERKRHQTQPLCWFAQPLMHNRKDAARVIFLFCDRFPVCLQAAVFMVFYPCEQKMTS